MIFVYIFSGIALLASFMANTQKTVKAIMIAKKKLLNILPHFLLMIVLVSIVLYFMPDTVIAESLGDSNLPLSTAFASFLGSLSVMPGFIVFPLGGILIEKGVSYMVLAAFTTSLMLVGVLTYPLEQKFLGAKITILRNIIGYLVSLAIAVAIGIFYGEVF